MPDLSKFYIDGAWVAPSAPRDLSLIDPVTEQPMGTLAMGNGADVDKAVAAARAAFPDFAATAAAERVALLRRILSLYRARYDEFAEAMRREMGSPITFAKNGQAARGPAHLEPLIEVLEHFAFEQDCGTTRLRYEPIGVCGLITPWNWPINQVVVKVAPALAAGCTVVLKPSEFSAISALMFAEVLDEAGVPTGVFNLVNGDGPNVGARITAHPDIDMVSFTGSTRAGIEVARTAADTVKRVAQELGGKSANVFLDDVELAPAVERAVAACFTNAGQSCSIPTRLLVPREWMGEIADLAAAAAAGYVVGATDDPATQIGPLVNGAQYARVQQLIRQGIDEGARLVAGGPGRPQGLERGYFVRPTVFADVTPDMTIAREEIFGPVLSIIGYDSEDEAVAIANGTAYGLAAYVQSTDIERARHMARRLNGGQVHINYPPADFKAPFGGYRHSGNGREWGEAGLYEYLETKAMIGYGSG
ncbi:aldehyde dehydrogenase [Salinisphaera sp. T5B8]|uniref:aldehyde dehydrogenase family protein n=1 Tax=Salinisphaera sp. T5B8 TaxID=1304154 RepID=UPI00333EBF89